MKLEFEYGGRTYLIDKEGIYWNTQFLNRVLPNSASVETDLTTGESIYVNWDAVGVLRQASERTEPPRPAAAEPAPVNVPQPFAFTPPTEATSSDAYLPTETTSRERAPLSDKDAEKLVEASDPNTSPGRLNQLARMVPAARTLAARNPASPPSLLTWLKELKDPAIDEVLRSR